MLRFHGRGLGLLTSFMVTFLGYSTGSNHFKDILPQNEKRVVLLLCSPVNYTKKNIHALFGRLKQFFSCFYRSIFDTPFCYLLE